MLFDDCVRDDHFPVRPDGSLFEYLDPSADPEVQARRTFLNRELVSFPSGEREKLIQRFRQGEEHDIASATFELILWDGLIQRGYQLEPHPTLPSGMTTHPDFRVTAPNGERFYLEARLANERWAFGDQHDQHAKKLKEVVMERINELSHPVFYLWWSDEGLLSSPPPARRIRDGVKKWLDCLSYDDVDAIKKRGGPCPEWCWPTNDDMESGAHPRQMRLHAIPLEPYERNTGGPLLRNGLGGGGWANFEKPLATALTKKANRYGTLDLPLIVAVNVEPGFLSRGDEVRTLFGGDVRYIAESREAFLPTRPGGFWHYGTSP